MEIIVLHSYKCKDIVYEIFFLYMNSVSRLCLRLRDTAWNFNLSFDMCRWLVEDEGVGAFHEVLVRHHRLLTSRPLLRQ